MPILHREDKEMMESKNYFDKNGNYINVENLSLAEIYHRAFALGVESVDLWEMRQEAT